MAQKIIEVVDGVVVTPEFAMSEPINLCIETGEQVAILGDNASGKTRLIEILTGHYRVKGDAIRYDFTPSSRKYVSDNVKYITFRDSYGAADASYYMQQRWNQMDIDPETPTIGQLFERSLSGYPEGSEEHKRFEQLVEMFHLKALNDKYIITLSSGELRKFLLTRLLITVPRVLIIDNPFIGLDAETRKQLADLFELLVRESHITIVLVLAREDEIPSFITHVIPVEGMKVGAKYAIEPHEMPEPVSLDIKDEGEERNDVPEVLRFNDVSIRYENRTILKELNWVVRQGEHWALTGENGSGKSTLLSLVNADNPQSYACDIELFGRKRGTGESIWDIKKNIGFVSPEMHRAYSHAMPALDIVSSGIFDTVGLHRRPTEAQRESCRRWMERFGIGGLAERNFLKLSSGEQRLCLLARAFVKEPPLLILDEPMHGLDEQTRTRVRNIINEYCSDPSKTLVMVTHYLEELPSCIDHHLFLRRN
ncbi:MAG: ATP-binding cassette domain-containing protein [Bacteroidales bacterium]|nr:ATP-binding cassette domain-containing protein [Bacteroidales bacterium]